MTNIARPGFNMRPKCVVQWVNSRLARMVATGFSTGKNFAPAGNVTLLHVYARVPSC